MADLLWTDTPGTLTGAAPRASAPDATVLRVTDGTVSRTSAVTLEPTVRAGTAAPPRCRSLSPATRRFRQFLRPAGAIPRRRRTAGGRRSRVGTRPPAADRYVRNFPSGSIVVRLTAITPTTHSQSVAPDYTRGAINGVWAFITATLPTSSQSTTYSLGHCLESIGDCSPSPASIRNEGTKSVARVYTLDEPR